MRTAGERDLSALAMSHRFTRRGYVRQRPGILVEVDAGPRRVHTERQRMSRHTSHGTAWNHIRAQVLAEEVACHRCGSTYFDPRPRHPLSKSVDHYPLPLSLI